MLVYSACNCFKINKSVISVNSVLCKQKLLVVLTMSKGILRLMKTTCID